MIYRNRFLLPAVMLAFFSILPVAAQSQTRTTETAADVSNTSASAMETVTSETLPALSAEIATALANVEKVKESEPDSEMASGASDLLKQASEQLKLVDKYTSETKENQRIVREAPAALKLVQDELKNDEGVTTPSIGLPTTATAEMVDQRISTAKAELANLQKKIEGISAEQQRRSTRMTAIPADLVTARQGLTEASIAAKSKTDGEDAIVAQARRLSDGAHFLAAQARIKDLESEQERYNAREELLPLARQLLTQRVNLKQALLKALEDRVGEARRAEATQSAKDLKKAASETQTSHPLVRSVASENTTITAQWDLGAVVEKQDSITDQLQKTRDEAQRITEQYDGLRTKFETVGYSDALGLLLRNQHKELPDLRSHREALEVRKSKLNDINLKLLETQDMVNELADPEQIVQQKLAEGGVDTGTSTGKAVRSELNSLLQARREYLSKVREGYDKLLKTMIELNDAEEELVRKTSSFSDFIDERILWLPSSDRISLDSVTSAFAAVKDFVSPVFWVNYGKAYYQRCSETPLVSALCALFLIFLVLIHRRSKLKLRELLQTASRNRLGAFRPLMRAMVNVVLYVLPLPAVAVFLGLPLVNVYHVPLQVAALANGLLWGGLALFALQLTKVLLNRHGLTEVFFNWPETSVRRLRRIVNLLLWIYVPIVILVRMWEFNGSDSSMEAARIVLVVALLLISWITIRLLRPKSSILAGTEAYRSSGFLYRVRYLVFIIVPALPAALALAALAGYVYTSIILTQRLYMSFWLGALALIISETAFFWILVKRRRLAIEAARKRREAAKAQHAESEKAAKESGTLSAPSAPSTPGAPSAPGAPAGFVEPELDITAISQQAGRLLRVLVLGVFVVALWFVWADVLPALRYLDSQQLWTVSRTISETANDETVHSVEKLVPITLADLLLALLVMIGAVGALRNIPGLLDITIYQKLSTQSGVRYAYNTLIRYIIIAIGAAYICYLMGLQWKQIQWMLAGVSVGLGFGLQEIFANFVSGLILLFERPVRVGDFIAVGDIKGNVTQIQIRATTVLDWDHFENIIPNKEMITKSVQNWTLTDLRRRLVIHVRVKYGSDYDHVRDILLKVAKANPYVLDDPGPAAGIEQLTDSCVLLVVFAHLPNSNDYLIARHTLIAEFVRQLTAAGVTIPFPQMDVHLGRPPQ